MRQGWIAWFILFTLAGCQPAAAPRTASEQTMFGASYMRIHPTFTHLITPSDQSGFNGIDAVIEFQDQFGEPTRSAGDILFEMYAYRASDPNQLGIRLAHWQASINSKDDQINHWNPAVRGYSFELQYDSIDPDRSYVLTAQVNRPSGGRFFGQLVLETTHEGKHSGRPTPHAALEDPGH